MEDMIIKGTGNSRWLKSVANIMTLYPTYESFAEALAAGTFPIDLNGINPAGVQTSGTRLNKANLLTDALCTALGLSTTATPTQAMEKLLNLIENGAKLSVVGYTGTGKYGESNPCSITFPFAPRYVLLMGSVNAYTSLVWSNLLGKDGSQTVCYVPDMAAYYACRGDGFFLNEASLSYAKKGNDGKTIYWYHTFSADSQFNTSRIFYRFLAIG